MQEDLKNTNIHTVFVSPYVRALETCAIIFEKHVNKENIKIKVLPCVSEKVINYLDLTEKTFKAMEKYSKPPYNFDFSLFL